MRPIYFYFGPYSIDVSIEGKYLKAGDKYKKLAHRLKDPIRVKDIDACATLETHRLTDNDEYILTVGAAYAKRGSHDI